MTKTKIDPLEDSRIAEALDRVDYQSRRSFGKDGLLIHAENFLVVWASLVVIAHKLGGSCGLFVQSSNVKPGDNWEFVKTGDDIAFYGGRRGNETGRIKAVIVFRNNLTVTLQPFTSPDKEEFYLLSAEIDS